MHFDLSFENYVYLQTGVLIFGVIFLAWRGPRTGFRLRLKGRAASKLVVGQKQYRQPQKMAVGAEFGRPDTMNIHFNYNGHTFDAYEVLGVPAGSSWQRVEEAYNVAADRSDPTARDFLQAALHAIQKHLNVR